MELPRGTEMTDVRAIGRIFVRMITDVRGVAAEATRAGRVEGIKPISFLATILLIFFIGSVTVASVRAVHWSVSLGEDMWEENDELAFIFNIAPKEIFGATLAELWTPGDSVMSRKIEEVVGSQDAEEVARYLADRGQTEAAQTIRDATRSDRLFHYLSAALTVVVTLFAIFVYASLGRRIVDAPDEMTAEKVAEPLMIWSGFWLTVTMLPDWLTLLLPTSGAASSLWTLTALAALGVGFYHYHLILSTTCGSQFKRNLQAYAICSVIAAGAFVVGAGIGALPL